MDLRGRSFKGADLKYTNFSAADLRGADFTGANLTGADFSKSLTGMKMSSKIILFFLALTISLFSGYLAMLLGTTVQGMIKSTDWHEHYAGLIATGFIVIFTGISMWKGIYMAARQCAAHHARDSGGDRIIYDPVRIRYRQRLLLWIICHIAHGLHVYDRDHIPCDGGNACLRHPVHYCGCGRRAIRPNSRQAG